MGAALSFLPDRVAYAMRRLLVIGAALAAYWVPQYAYGQVPDESEPATEAFDVWEYRVSGNTILNNRSIERAVYDHLGPDKTIADVELARGALERSYREAGFSTVLVSIPEQTVDAGVVRLEVTEGKIGKVRVRDARYVSGRRIRAAVDSVQPGEPIYFPALQADLQDLARLSADRTVTPVLKPGRFPGEVDLDLRVDDALPLHGSLEINDRYTADTEELRVTGSLSYDNLFQRAHSFSLQYTTAPQRTEDTKVWAATYLWKFAESPTVLALYAVDTDSDVATLGDINVLGVGNIYGMRIVRPLEGSASFNHGLSLGVDYKDFTETVRTPVLPEPDTPTDVIEPDPVDEADDGVVTPISYTALSASYNFGWNSDRYLSSYDLGMTFGSSFLGNSRREFEDKRFKAKPNFFYTRFGTEQLLRAWGGIGLYGRFSGQLTSSPLISNEQFSIGGARSVRGYLEAEVLGDYGFFGNVEVRSPDIAGRMGSLFDSLYLFAFYDAGAVWLHDPLPGQDDYTRIDGAGAGLRLITGFGALLAADWATPLRDSINIQSGEDRLHFSLRWQF